jgi:hypothetical protein
LVSLHQFEHLIFSLPLPSLGLFFVSLLLGFDQLFLEKAQQVKVYPRFVLRILGLVLDLP